MCHVTVRFAFLNSTVIQFVSPSVYIEILFSSVYLHTNFTVELILSVKLLVKVTHHRTFLAFFISSFSTAIPLVYTNRMFHSVFTEGYSDGKVRR